MIPCVRSATMSRNIILKPNINGPYISGQSGIQQAGDLLKNWNNSGSMVVRANVYPGVQYGESCRGTSYSPQRSVLRHMCISYVRARVIFFTRGLTKKSKTARNNSYFTFDIKYVVGGLRRMLLRYQGRGRYQSPRISLRNISEGRRM